MAMRIGSLDRESGSLLAFGFALFVLIAAGVPLGGDLASSLMCLMLLLVGLPHGALDIERLKLAWGTGSQQVTLLFGLYLGLAAMTFAFWQWSPVVAMALFLATAAVHFAEDFEDMPDPLLGLGTACALLCAPALFHKAELRDIFAVVAGARDAALLAEAMQAIAPVALALAAVGIVALIGKGLRNQALSCSILLAAMLLAPPIAGFLLFFCVFHSPRHLREVWGALASNRVRLLSISLALTAGAIGLTVVLIGWEARGGLPQSLVAATFMTFSILTVPHMLAPLLVDRIGRARMQAAPTK